MHAVESKRIEPHGDLRHVRMLLGVGRNRTPDQTPHHHDFEAELSGDIFKLFDSLVGCVHRDDRSGCHTVGEGAKVVCTKGVKRPAGDAAQVGIRDARYPEALCRVEHCKVEAEFLHPLIQQPRHHRRGPVARILGGQRPKCLLRDPVVTPLGNGHGQLLHYL